VTLDQLNALSTDAASRELERCCGSRRWAAAMADRRPFPDVEELYRAAEDVWWSLDEQDWLEAFSHHPRIGQRAAGWARDEQAGVATAPRETMTSLAALNSEYERKFGHVFLIYATGRSAEDMLSELRRRIGNDPHAELRNAAAEQARITRLRLEKMLSPSFESSRTG
jgi:OHCU decarboxylase